MEEVKDAVKKELEGSGRLLGYRAMHKKVRKENNLHVTRDAVYNVMYMAMNILFKPRVEATEQIAQIELVQMNICALRLIIVEHDSVDFIFT